MRGAATAALVTGLLLGCAGEEPDRTWELTAQGVYAGVLSNDAKLAVVGSLNHGASLWRVTDYERLFDWSHKPGQPVELVAAAFSPDGSRAVTADPRTLVLWDTASGEALQFWGTPGAVLDAAVLPGGTEVLLGMEDHSAILFDAADGRHRFTLIHEGQVPTVDVSADGKLALTGSDDNNAILWSLSDGERLHTFQHDNPVRKVALSDDGRFALTAISKEQITLWDVDSRQPMHVLYERNPGLTSARFAEDGNEVLLGFVNRSVELWGVQSGQRLQHWTIDPKNPWHPAGAAVLSLAFTPAHGDFRSITGDGRLAALSR